MLNNTRPALRVSVIGLILGAALVATPGLPFGGRTSTVQAAPSVMADVPATPAQAAVAAATAEEAPTSTVTSFDVTAWDAAVRGAVNPEVLTLALEAAERAVERGDAGAPTTLTVIDFSIPSTEKRMWVYDLSTRELLYEEHVSHGRGSGQALATVFSNQPESNRSSLGLYRTAETYVGKHGYSLRLDGLEKGVNDRARERAIVMHAADYVNPAAAKAQGYLGRSLGCPAVRPEISRELIDTVKGGGLLFAYFPDQEWLGSSSYLN